MSTELLIFLLTCGLAFLHFFLPPTFKFLQVGLPALAGPRDGIEFKTVYGHRAHRTNENFKETLPIALGLLLMVIVLNKGNGTTALGAWMYLVSRCIYIPLYLLGVPYLRTLVWGGALAGLILIFSQLF